MKTIDQKSLGRHFSEVRKAHYMTQRQLEEEADIAKGMVSKYEQGVTLDEYIGEIPVVEV